MSIINIIKTINTLLTKPIIRLIKIYQYTLSPDIGIPSLRLKGKICAHEPHCSKYSIQVLKRYGFRPGIFYAGDRILHCTTSMIKHYDPAHYKIVFFSSAPIGIPFLETLVHDKRFEIVGVVTQCDKPAGRGMKTCENIIKQYVKENKQLQHCDIMTPEKLDPETSEGRIFIQWLKEKKPDYLVVIAYGKIIPQIILDIPHIAPINVHGSLLPKYRGASPIQSALLNNDKETGITIIKMNANMDAGNIINTLKFTLPFLWTAKDVIEYMQKIGPKFLNNTLRKFGKQLLGETQQDESQATYCKKIEKKSGFIDPRNDPLQTIYCKYRAYYLRPKIYFERKGKRIIIEEMKINESIYNCNEETPLFRGNELHPAVENMIVKPEGKKAIERKEFLNGYLK